MLRSLLRKFLRPLWRPVIARVDQAVQAHTIPLASRLANLQAAIDALPSALGSPREESAIQLLYPLTPRRDFDDFGLTAPDAMLHGICPVCGRASSFGPFNAGNIRESGPCASCGSFNRQRQLACMVRERCGIAPDGAFSFPPGFVVYNTETTGALHRQLQGVPGYVCSEYFGPQHVSGTWVGGRLHQDLQTLSLDDASLDLILSSDVLEHMPAPYQAHREILRALKPGGRHIFTVPFNQLRTRDDVRAEQRGDEVVHLSEALYHGDPVRPEEGVLVWTIFGLDMLAKLTDLGYEVSMWNLYAPRQGIVGSWSLVFEAMKPE